ncbi:hypothetical protein_gp157 [Bacillus phage vB_BceM_WH1]|nr:hypothetical protein_gp157 [Bacillus phage vB_BceM_WH1]
MNLTPVLVIGLTILLLMIGSAAIFILSLLFLEVSKISKNILAKDYNQGVKYFFIVILLSVSEFIMVLAVIALYTMIASYVGGM